MASKHASGLLSMITAQVESFERALPELMSLFPRHWEELALYRDRMPLDPQYPEYVRRERTGALLLVTVRVDGRISAYYTAQLAPGFHYQSTLAAHMDMMYVVPEQRHRGLAVPLFRCVELELRRRGVKLWYSGYKASNPNQLNRVLPVLGFQPADVYMAKWIGDAP